MSQQWWTHEKAQSETACDRRWKLELSNQLETHQKGSIGTKNQ